MIARLNYNGLKVQAVYFHKNKNLLFSTRDLNIAWFRSINEKWQSFDTYIPSDFYYDIADQIKNEDGKNQDFFEAILKRLYEAQDTVSEEELRSLVAKTDTKCEKQYKEESSRPYFHFWRRGSAPGEGNAEKINATFGWQALVRCQKERIHAVWSEAPTSNCLAFIDEDPFQSRYKEKVDV